MQIAEDPAGSAESLDPAAGLRQLAAAALGAYLAEPSNAGLCREARNSLLALSAPRDGEAADEFARLAAELSRPVYTDSSYDGC